MKRTFSAFFTLLMSISASASIYDTNHYPGNNSRIDDAALRICEGMSSYNRNQCLQTILGKGFSRAGVKVCTEISIYNEAQKMSCLESIANNAYQYDATLVCKSMTDFFKMDCMKSIANRRFVPEALATCNKISIYTESIKLSCMEAIAEKTFAPKALSLCGTLSDYSKVQCIEDAAGGFYQDAAVNVCARISIYSEASKMTCMNNIKNRIYDERLLGFCANGGEYQINSCLVGIQSTSTSLPGFNMNRQRSDLDIILDALDYMLNGNVQRQGDVVIVQRPVVVQKPAVNTCLAREQNGKVASQTVVTSQFYELARNTAIETGKCVVARMANTDRSSVLYDASGRTRAKNASYREIDTLKRESSDLKGKGCYQFICDDVK